MEHFPPTLDDAVDRIIAAYVDAVDAGQDPDRADWLRRYPEAADALAEFFADQDSFRERVAPLRLCAASIPPMQDEASFPAPGTTLGGYELVAEIARGGMGVVFKARQVRLNRHVALKMIRTGARASGAELERFRLEAEAAAKLDHPNIVPIFEIDAWEGRPYFTMRLIEGGSLAQCLPRFQADPLATARALAAIARAVHFAHQRGILHRDLKPANILVDATGQPHVTDFGLAKWVDGMAWHAAERDAESAVIASVPGANAATDTPVLSRNTVLSRNSLTQQGLVVGTPSYMAPEQAAPAPGGPTTAVDVYSLGAILYEMLTGRPPFREATAAATIQVLLGKPLVPPRQVQPRVPLDLEAICLKCLEKDPARRYASAAALADDLERFVRCEPIEARPVGTLGRLGRWCRRQRALAATLALAVVGLVTATVVSVLLAVSEARSVDRIGQALGEARTQKTNAELNLKKTQAALADRDKAVDRADEERLRADKNFRNAHKAIDDYYLKFRERGLGKIPGLQSFEKELMQTALVYYKDFIEQKGHDPKLRLELARTCFRAGDITHHLGGKAEAIPYYDRAIEVATALLQEDPRQAALYQAVIAGALGNRGVVYRALGKLPAALDSYQRATEVAEELIRTRPGDFQGRRNLALSYVNISSVQRSLGQLDNARSANERAQDVLTRLRADLLERKHKETAAQRDKLDLEVLHTEWDLSRAELKRAGILDALGQANAAFDANVKAQQRQQEIAARMPHVKDYQKEAAETGALVGRCLVERGQTADGLRLALAARKAMEALVLANPDVPTYQLGLAETCRTLGSIHRGAKEPDKARLYLQEAFDRLEKLTARYPRVPQYESEFALMCYELGVFHAGAGDKDKARELLQRAEKLARRLADSEPDNLEYRNDWARCMARLNELTGATDKTAATAERWRQTIEQRRRVYDSASADSRKSLRDAVGALVKLLADSGQLDEGRRERQEAVAFHERLAKENAADFEQQYEWAYAIQDAGRDLRARGEPRAGLAVLEQALAVFARIAKEAPAKAPWQYAHCHFQIGLTHGVFKDRPEQLRHFRLACDIQEAIVNRPDLPPEQKPQAHSSLGTFLHNLAQTHARLDQFKEAEETFHQAIAHQRKAMDAAPKVAGYRAAVSTHYAALAEFLRERGRQEEAQRLWAERPK